MGETIKKTPTYNERMSGKLLNSKLSDAVSIYDSYQTLHESQAVDRVVLKNERGSSFSVLHMAELLVGNRDAAVGFYRDTIDQVSELPSEMRPNGFVISGLMQGDFKYTQKNRRPSLLRGMQSMNQQFAGAKELIDYARDRLQVPIVYNLSNDDHRIAEDYTIEMMRKMHDYTKDQEQVTYYKQDRLRQHPEWSRHLQFQTDIVFPYCLRLGRRLRSAEEVAALTDGREVEEYFLLYEAVNRLKSGKRPREDGTGIIDHEALEAAYRRGKTDDLYITDDVDMMLKTKGRTYTNMIRHNLNFTGVSMPASHMKSPIRMLGNLAANDQPTPDMLLTQNNQEAVAAGTAEGWVISVGGMTNPTNFLTTKGSANSAAGDITRRLNTTRRRAHPPNATVLEQHDDGRLTLTVFNEKLNEKAYSLKDRLAIALYCDWQTGSITARPDLQVKFMDYIRTRKLGEKSLAIFVGGDIVHGRNYPDFPNESQSTGLMSMDSQIEFVKTMLRAEFANMTPDNIKALESVVIEPGNHEWNSGTKKWHGYSFIDYLEDAFKDLYRSQGLSEEEIRKKVQYQDAIMTPKGEFAKTYSGIGYFGDMGVEVRHFALERGGKGSGSDLPIYQQFEQAVGVGGLKRAIDFNLYGHWHHPQYGVFGDKLAVVGGSLAGLSGYEYERAYRPVISGTVLEIGGGLPPQVEFIAENTLHAHKIKSGPYSDKELRREGYKTDREFDPKQHGIMLPDRFAKSALQKKLLAMMRESSQSTHRVGTLR